MSSRDLIVRIITISLLTTYLWLVLPGDLRAPIAIAALAIAPLYLLAHALRGLRLFLVLYDGKLRLRDALSAHFHAAGVSALIPFKLGELYRILMVHGLSVGVTRAVIAIWIERVFDALLVAALLGLLAVIAGPPTIASVTWFLPLLVIFLFASVLLFLVLPENLVLVKRHLISKHNNATSLAMLRLIDGLHRVIADASRIWRTRSATILWLSLGIWALEVGCVLVALTLTGGNLDFAGNGARILSELTLRSSPWALVSGTEESALACYRLGTVDLLAIIALVIAVISPVRQAHRNTNSTLVPGALLCT